MQRQRGNDRFTPERWGNRVISHRKKQRAYFALGWTVK